MTLGDIIDIIRVNVLPSLSNPRQMTDESLTIMINEGIRSLHNIFNINTEQAIILVPAFRNTFKLDNTDPNVIMASYYKLAECAAKATYNTKAELIRAALDLNKNLKENILLNNESTNKEVFSTKHDQVMKMLNVSDDKHTEYILNEKNAYAVDQNTLYFPHCRESDVIYVKYKPKPIKATTAAMDAEIDLPDTLLDVLYAYIPLRVITGIQGYTQLYPNLLNTYNLELQKAREVGAVVPDNLEAKYVAQKGFI